MKKSVKILIDNGHGADTPGKCSPDKAIREYAWNREIARRLLEALTAEGFDARRIVTEESDIPLSERVRRVNAVCSKAGAKNCVLVSIHINAAGHGQWMNASGWSGWVAPNASDRSKLLARMMHEEAEKRGLKGNRSVPSGRYWTGNFTILKKTSCPAVLTENLFMDNEADAKFLLSEKGKQTIVDLHVAALRRYIDSL